MLLDNKEITKVELETCGFCGTPLGNIFSNALARSKEDLARALDEYTKYKKYGSYTEGATLKITCPMCNIRSEGKVPLADETRPMTTKLPTETTTNEDE